MATHILSVLFAQAAKIGMFWRQQFGTSVPTLPFEFACCVPRHPTGESNTTNGRIAWSHAATIATLVILHGTKDTMEDTYQCLLESRDFAVVGCNAASSNNPTSVLGIGLALLFMAAFV